MKKVNNYRLIISTIMRKSSTKLHGVIFRFLLFLCQRLEKWTYYSKWRYMTLTSHFMRNPCLSQGKMILAIIFIKGQFLTKETLLDCLYWVLDYSHSSSDIIVCTNTAVFWNWPVMKLLKNRKATVCNSALIGWTYCGQKNQIWFAYLPPWTELMKSIDLSGL